MTPKGLLFDYGGTLVDEVSVDSEAGNAWLLSRASYRPAHVTLDDVLERAARVTSEVAAQRDRVQIETAWPTLTRLIHDYFGIRFDELLDRRGDVARQQLNVARHRHRECDHEANDEHQAARDCQADRCHARLPGFIQK